MSTATATPATPVETTRPGIPFTRLVSVEARKMFDTAAGFWLTLSIVGLAVLATAIVIVVGAVQDITLTHNTFVSAIGYPLSLLLPVLAILAVTSEWSQRTGLVTFALEPRRSRVVLAKLGAVLGVGLATVAVAIGIGALANLVWGLVDGSSPSWDVGAAGVVNWVLIQLLALVMGFAFATLIRTSAPAIVAYYGYVFVGSSLFGVAAAFLGWFRDIWPWVEIARAQSPLSSPEWLGGQEWAQLATASAIWIVLPLAIGVWRLLRAEVK